MMKPDVRQGASNKSSASWREIPSGVWALGFVSLLMDVSSEMIHALLPVYLVVVLGTTTFTVGIIEGVAEATAAILKVFSGALSDRLGKRKFLAALGYGLAAFTKPIFPLASSVGWLIAARFIDRVGKGIRGAPRDALVADISPNHIRGASFGFRQSLDTVGAFAGPLLAIFLMWLTGDHFVSVFWIAVMPAFLAFALMVVAVDEPLMLVPVVLVIMNIAYAFSAYPVGALSDRIDRMTILLVGLFVLLVADLILAFAAGVMAVLLGAMLWGLHMGFTQGLLAALVADTAPAELRGTAFGVFNLVTGLALLLASLIAGALWDAAGPQATFLAGAAFTVLTLGLIAGRRRLS